ncbi:hypothetical protein [Geotalea sp. SG265]|uniref:hypothetical protein n=1 Tax=Geotalea sp. SG265 TaxID=2922867 RepID=UPI001FAEB531|nr:hypothetical protein [Geotalea sp. SG265]
MNRKKLTLAILVLVLILSVIYSFFSQPRQKKAANLKYGGQTSPTSQRSAKAFSGLSSARLDEKKLHLELLDKEHPKFAGFRRNLFSPIFHEEAKPEAKPTGRITLPVPPPPPLRPPPSVVPPVAQIPEPTPVQRDMARFTFLGFLKKDNTKTIFLSSDKEIFLVKKGDTIAGKYQVANLTDDALTIRPLADGGEIVIPLVENKSLAAPKR